MIRFLFTISGVCFRVVYLIRSLHCQRRKMFEQNFLLLLGCCCCWEFSTFHTVLFILAFTAYDLFLVFSLVSCFFMFTRLRRCKSYKFFKNLLISTFLLSMFWLVRKKHNAKPKRREKTTVAATAADRRYLTKASIHHTPKRKHKLLRIETMMMEIAWYTAEHWYFTKEYFYKIQYRKW